RPVPQPRRARGSGVAQPHPHLARHRFHARVHRAARGGDARGRRRGAGLMQLVILSGVSGSGKSVALKALEDAGYYCVDNLPADLIGPLADYAAKLGEERVAISADARSRESLGRLPAIVEREGARGTDVRVIFLDATDQGLVRRFSESRRPHPLAAE